MLMKPLEMKAKLVEKKREAPTKCLLSQMLIAIEY